MKIRLALLCSLFAVPAFAQSSDMLGRNSDILTVALIGGQNDSALGVEATHSIQQSDANQPNGYTKLALNQNATSPLLNNTHIGVSDSGTNVANGNQIKDAVNKCNQSSPTVFYGADNSNSEIANPANTEHLRASGNVAPSFSIQSINAIVNPNGGGGGENDINGPSGLAGMQAIFAVSGNVGMGGAWYSKNMTPSIPSKYDTFHMRDGKGNIVDEVALLKSVNFQPSIMLLNLTTDASIGNKDGTQAFTTQDVTNASLAEADIKKEFPSVKYVWGYFQANVTHPDFAKDPYWANARTIALNTGGLAIDMPSGLQVLNTYKYIIPAVSTIKWANANGVKVMILLTPYSLDRDPYNGKVYPQWRMDRKFLENTKLLVSWLAGSDALPSAWIVGNYTPIQYWDPNTHTLSTNKDRKHTEMVTANTFGSDTDDVQPSVAYVTRWVAENAPINQKNALPAGLFGQTTHACATTAMDGFNTTKAVISASNTGLGSMAYQDMNNMHVVFPTLYGAVVQNGVLDMIGSRLVWGTNQAGSISENWSKGQLTYSSSDNTGSLEYYVDLHMDQGHNIAFRGGGKNGIAFQNADNSVTTWLYGDGKGGINIGRAIHIAPGSTGKATFKNGTSITGGVTTDKLHVSTLTGTGNAYACLDASGKLYRSNTPCVGN